MAGEPVFFTPNYIDELAVLDSDNPASDATLPRLRDRDDELKFRTSGANSDLTTVNIEAEFRSDGLAYSRQFDTVVVLGHNLKDFLLQYWDGAAWVTLSGGTFVGVAANYTVLTFAAVTATKVRISATATQVADQEKEVGEFMALKTLLTVPTDGAPGRLGLSAPQTAYINRALDFGLAITQLRWAGNRVERFRARIGFNLTPKVDYDALRALVRQSVVTVRLEPTERPTEFFLVTMTPGGAPSGYSSAFKGAGYDIELELEEV